MLKEGKTLAGLAPNVTIKVPLTHDGLKTCKALSDDGKKVNVTLCFSAGQAILAAKAGAAYISPFVGRLRTASEIHLLFESYIYKERRVSMMGPFSSGGSVHAASVAGSANNIV